MRYLNDIPHPNYRIGLYAWNNKYILKIEAGMLEQTYKIDETEVAEPAQLPAWFDAPFLERVSQRFAEMAADWQAVIARHEWD